MFAVYRAVERIVNTAENCSEMFARELVATALICALLHRAVALPVSINRDEPASNSVQRKLPRNEGKPYQKIDLCTITS